MEYRHLGKSGLRVSVLSFGSWVTFGQQVDQQVAVDCLQTAWDRGVNFFDNAEVYAGGQSERVMGECLRKLGWPRHQFVVSSKFFWGLEETVNVHYTLNRKYLRQAVDKSLKRFGFDFLDLIYAHRPDPSTPIEETVWTMHNLIEQGKALYWGTSEWSADEIRSAIEIANRNHLHRPLMEQPQYNLFARERVEKEYRLLYRDYQLGLTTFSPLAAGLLTGKYIDGVPAGSRATVAGLDFLHPRLLDPANNALVAKLKKFAGQELGCSIAQLAVAWCARNPNVSSVILGASRASQLEHTLESLPVVKKLTAEVMAKIDQLCGETGFKTLQTPRTRTLA